MRNCLLPATTPPYHMSSATYWGAQRRKFCKAVNQAMRSVAALVAMAGAAAAAERELQVTDSTFSVLPAPKSSTCAASSTYTSTAQPIPQPNLAPRFGSRAWSATDARLVCFSCASLVPRSCAWWCKCASSQPTTKAHPLFFFIIRSPPHHAPPLMTVSSQPLDVLPAHLLDLPDGAQPRRRPERPADLLP